MADEGGFGEYRRLLLAELERLNDESESLRIEMARMERTLLDRLNHLQSDIVMLKIRSGIWGAVAGLLPALGVAILWLISQRH